MNKLIAVAAAAGLALIATAADGKPAQDNRRPPVTKPLTRDNALLTNPASPFRNFLKRGRPTSDGRAGRRAGGDGDDCGTTESRVKKSECETKKQEKPE